jgi:uncharacterized protein YeaO (DUF488 family)
VPKAEFASRDFYDVWLPTLSPSPELFTKARAAKHDARLWNAFVRRFKAEMKTPGAGHVLDLLAALSRTADFSLGCYCTDERCHRFVLQSLLRERGARMAP